MKMELFQQKQTVKLILDAGELLLSAGAEINRVEDTIKRMTKAYGFMKTDVFCITSNIIVTVQTKENEIFTQTRRVAERTVNMCMIENVNALSRSLETSLISLSELEKIIMGISEKRKTGFAKTILAYLLIAGALSVFFGGSFRDGFAAMICSMVLYAAGKMGESLKIQPMVRLLLSTIVMCMSAFFMVSIGIGQSTHAIIIGNIMLLIPGVYLVSALRDMIAGDIMSGLLGICDALLRSASIAMGCALVIMWMGGAA